MTWHEYTGCVGGAFGVFSMETPEQRRARLERARQRRRENETPEQRERRLERMRREYLRKKHGQGGGHDGGGRHGDGQGDGGGQGDDGGGHGDGVAT